MKRVISMSLILALTTPAFAQNANELESLVQDSQAAAGEAANEHAAELRRLIGESNTLREKIVELKAELDGATHRRNRRIIISAGLAAAFVAIGRSQTSGGDLTGPMAAFAKMIGMGVTGIGAIGYGGAATYTHFGVIVKDKNKLLQLEVQLAEVTRLLNERLAALN